MKSYEYTLYVGVHFSSDVAMSSMDRRIYTVLNQPIEELLDNEKAYIKLPEGHIIMKHAIKLIVDKKKADQL